MRIGVGRNATGVAAMRFQSSTRVYRVYGAAADGTDDGGGDFNDDGGEGR